VSDPKHGFSDFALLCERYFDDENLVQAEKRIAAVSADEWRSNASALAPLLKYGTHLLREYEVNVTRSRNFVKLWHDKFLILVVALQAGFVVVSGIRNRRNVRNEDITLGDLDVTKIDTVYLFEDAIDAIAQHLVRMLKQVGTHARNT
jgi:hypothetical protein